MRPAARIVLACVLLSWPCFAATPALVQSIVHPNDLSGAGPQGWVISLPNPVQAGNAIVVAMTTNDNPIGNITVTDDKSDTYSVAKSEFAGSEMIAAFVALNVTAGAQLITVNIGTGGNNNSAAAYEFTNVATTSALDSTGCAATLTSGTTLTCGSWTTGTAGDLVIEFANVMTWSATPTTNMTWNAQSGSWLLLGGQDGTSFFGAQYEIQASAGAVNPAITVTSGGATVTRANVVGFALKSASSGSGPPAGIYVNNVLVANAPERTTQSGSTIHLQFPCVGNQLALGWQEGNDTTAVRVTGITDTNSNTWTSVTREDAANADAQMQWWYTTGTPTCNNSEQLTVTTTSSTSNPMYNLFDISGSGGLDTSYGTSGVANNTATTSAHSGTFSTTTGTPSQSNGLILSQMNLGQNTVVAVSIGYFIGPCINTTTTLACPNATLTNGSSPGVVSEGVNADQDQGLTMYYNPNTSAVTFSYKVYDSLNVTINEWWASSIAFKPLSAGGFVPNTWVIQP